MYLRLRYYASRQSGRILSKQLTVQVPVDDEAERGATDRPHASQVGISRRDQGVDECPRVCVCACSMFNILRVNKPKEN